MKTYCLFCHTGKERAVIRLLESKGFAAMSPTVVRFGTGSVKKLTKLLPGYVFFDADTEPEWGEILKNSGVIRLLGYDDGEYALRDTDLDFTSWLKRHNGTIELSHAIKVGTRIEFVDGPLRDMQGKIIKINKNRKQAQVALGGAESIVGTIWCSMEFIQGNADIDEPLIRD